MRLSDLLLDTWAPLSHKRPLREGRGLYTQGWLSEEARRRLTAYQLLRAYRDNVARAFLTAALADDPAANDHREYGDAELIVQQARSALLGEHQTIVVDGADSYDEALLDSDDPELTPDQLADNEAARAALEREEWLRTWADEERLPAKLVEAEGHAVGIGDGVYLLAWSAQKQRPRLRVIDPGFYFPVLREGLDADDYPERVHFAWELPGDPSAGIPTRVRRITYELGPIEPARQAGTTLRGRLRRVLPGGDEPAALSPGDARSADGRILRRYPWQAEGESSSQTCYLTDAEWNLDDVRGEPLDALDPDRATYALNEDGELLDRLDLRIDFLPIVHVPNTVAGAEHFGRSVLSGVLQLLDDLASSDTDTQAASATTGSPPIGLSGARMPSDTQGGELRIGPGEVWELGENGKLSTVDTSGALGALRATTQGLLDRLSVNSRLPAALLGRIKPSEVPSGVALQLSFGPLQSAVREWRLVRGEKYPLLLRMVQRLAMAGGALPPGETYRAELQLGSFLPSDTDALVGRAIQLYQAKVVSLETALSMVIEAGVPVEDVAEEVRRVTERDYAAAAALADATGDVDAVRELLGLPDAEAPTVVPDLLAGPPAPFVPLLPATEPLGPIEDA